MQSQHQTIYCKSKDLSTWFRSLSYRLSILRLHVSNVNYSYHLWRGMCSTEGAWTVPFTDHCSILQPPLSVEDAMLPACYKAFFFKHYIFSLFKPPSSSCREDYVLYLYIIEKIKCRPARQPDRGKKNKKC